MREGAPVFLDPFFFGADLDPDPGLLADPDPIRIQVILMDRAQNFECFTFLKFENPSSGSKVIILQSCVLFSKSEEKKIHFLDPKFESRVKNNNI